MEKVPLPVQWVYGVTTVPSRREALLPRTLASLRAGGFDAPRLFVDGACGQVVESYEHEFGLAVTGRNPPLKTASNWALSLAELYVRQPHADRYAIFQDDLICVANLRQYLDALMPLHSTRTNPKLDDAWPNGGKAYLNLYCAGPNDWERKAAGKAGLEKGKVGWFTAAPVNGKPKLGEQLFQKGWGAVALVFSSEGVRALLSNPGFVGRPMDRSARTENGTARIDGGIVHAMNSMGWLEVAHNPSLVRHVGELSSMFAYRGGGVVKRTGAIHQAESFPGESHDAMSLLELVG